MAKSSSVYQCTDCGYQSPKWLGRCPQCHQWGTLEEGNSTSAAVRTKVAKPVPGRQAQRISDIDPQTATAWPTGVGELDRVLGGGFVPGAVVLLAGEPGVGKSTLLLDVAARAARAKSKVLYVTGEESAGQVRLRAGRINALEDNLLLAAETDLGTVLGMVESEAPDLLVVDSVQTLASAEVEGVPGGVTQVREVAAAVIRTAKTHAIPTVLVGHITKDGNVAGPRLLEHLVDVVCSFEGDRHSRLRLLRALKNRFGPTDEVGCFDMTEGGIESLEDPSGLFLSRSGKAAPGTCLAVTQEGRRPLVVEVQALVAEAAGGSPRRTVSGVDGSRVAMNLAVLSKTLENSTKQDVFVSTVGGAKVTEPATDLAVCLALASAMANRPVYSRLVAIGEISLSGEIRRVPDVGRRLSEAARLGITNAVVARGSLENVKAPAGMRIRECEDLGEALQVVMP
ncbi:DNA repair protein RadA [Brevibacterium sp. 91QC2O2]|jgi:DNA repair protein RadA/Sms|uniref:DNA repair protein RadA n=1 Tax=Brevibacterium TaxID=1696 RepID=UPI00211C23A9|nr:MULTISPECIES: DNA repair protein RadA [unclassified Brevibacterium]MCQ9368195.1 DNA repair protein RadA [Brevibacterium sp. 91QC2O2]MCQ9385534.1 DNA repair protein RadA [Brevibacterium sp. 68QC2CO]